MKSRNYSGTCLFVAVATYTCLFACSQPHETTSNSRPDRQSLSTPSANDASNTRSINPDARATTEARHEDFWTKAATGGMAEVELGKLAQSKAANSQVKQFAEMMVVDHSRANDELKEIATRKNIALPTSVDAHHRSEMDRLGGMSGTEFDRAYVEAMVSDHQTTVQMFEEQAANSTDPDAKSFAERSLPTLRRHLERIRAIQQNMR